MFHTAWRAGILGAIIIASMVGPALAQTAEELTAAAKSGPGTPAFNRLLETLPSVKTKDANGIERRYYVIEGDILASPVQVFNWASEQSADKNEKPGGKVSNEAANSELIVLEVGGKKVFWPPERRNLTYSVDAATFPSKEAYLEVVRNFEQATRDWESRCISCGLKFQPIEPGAGAAPLFTVVYDGSAMDFIAAAFFPNDLADKRVVLVGPQYFTTTFDRIGVFRHEVGHILGYRHNHIIGVPGCSREGGGWIPLTPDGGRDSLSVMHYFCGGGGTRELKISATDEQGHRSLYGP